MKKILCILMLIIVLVFTGCGSSKGSSSSNAAPEQSKAAYGNSADYTSSTEASESKKIINCQIQITVDNLVNTSNEIETMAKNMGGYIENSEVNDYDCYSTVRIPYNNFDSFISLIEKKYEIKDKRIDSTDITEQYVDNDARLKNMKAQEAQMLEVYKKANTVEDILKVQSQLTEIRGNIESLEAKKKLWDRQVQYTTIKISIDKKQVISSGRVIIISGNDFAKSVSKGFINSVLYFVLAIEHIFIFLISNIILLAIIAGVLFVIYKKYKKLKKQ